MKRMEKYAEVSILARAKKRIDGDLIKPAKIRKRNKSLHGKGA